MILLITIIDNNGVRVRIELLKVTVARKKADLETARRQSSDLRTKLS